jgi:nicotinamidase-related amidase
MIDAKGRGSKLKKAILVIDVQNEYFTGKLPVTHPAGSLDNILRVMDTATAKQIPVIVIQHTAAREDSATFLKGTAEWELHPEVAKRPRDLLIEKNLPGSFTGTPLDDWLREHAIDSVVITGYMTQMCCDTTARQAFHRGYSVEFLSDATATLSVRNEGGSVTDEELHRAILVTQSMRFSRVLSAAEWLANL